MDELKATEQNKALGKISEILKLAEQNKSSEFLPQSLNVFGLFSDLFFPSSKTIEKMSYGDPLFRMPMQSNIPITTDKEYVSDVTSLIPIAAPASKVPKTVAKLSKKLKPIKFLDSKDLNLDWRHGTSEKSAEQIIKSGVFDPSKGKKSYSYSELGHDSVYLSPSDSWWLDPTQAASGLATQYPTSIKTEIAKNAKIAKVDTVKDLEAISSKIGFKNYDELLDALATEDYGKATKPNYKETLQKLKDAKIDGIYFSKNFNTDIESDLNLPATDQLAIFNKSVIKPKAIKNTFEDVFYNPLLQDTTK